MTALASTAAEEPARIGFGATLAAEWSKLWSVRSTWISVGLALVLSIGLTALLAVSLGGVVGQAEFPEELFDPILFSMPGSVFTLILLSVLAVMFVSSEYSSGMIRLTLTVTPRRWRILAAKALIIAIVALAVGIASAFGMFFVAQAVFTSSDLETASLGDPDALRAVLGLALTAPVFPLLGLALAFLLRSTAGAITAVLGIIFLPDVLGGLLPQWWQENVLVHLPAAASDAISVGHLDGRAFVLDLGPAVAVTVAWLVLFLGLAAAALLRRDA